MRPLLRNALPEYNLRIDPWRRREFPLHLAHGLLTPASTLPLDAAVAKRAAAFLNLRCSRFAGGSNVIAEDAWEFVLTGREGPEVSTGSQEIAERIRGTEDQRGPRTFSRRIEAANDVPGRA